MVSKLERIGRFCASTSLVLARIEANKSKSTIDYLKASVTSHRHSVVWAKTRRQYFVNSLTLLEIAVDWVVAVVAVAAAAQYSMWWTTTTTTRTANCWSARSLVLSALQQNNAFWLLPPHFRWNRMQPIPDFQTRIWLVRNLTLYLSISISVSGFIPFSTFHILGVATTNESTHKARISYWVGLDRIGSVGVDRIWRKPWAIITSKLELLLGFPKALLLIDWSFHTLAANIKSFVRHKTTNENIY